MASSQQPPADVREPPFPFSPGTMRLSDLERSEGGTLEATPPRRLKPISPPVQRKRKKQTRRPRQSIPSDPSAPDPAPPSETPPLMNQDMLSQLMAKMEDDPPTVTTTTTIVVPPAPSSPIPPQVTLSSTPPPSSPAVTETLVTVSASHEVSVHSTVERRERRRRKRRKQPNMELTGVTMETQEPVQESEDPIPVMKDTLSPISAGTVDSGVQTRQLPEFPMGPEASTQFPRSSVAMQPHIATPHKPNGVLQLLSEEDVVGSVADRSMLEGPQYTLPSAQPIPFMSRPKDVIFVERIDGKGFVAKRRDEPSPAGGVEEDLDYLDREVTGGGLALLVQVYFQRLALTAHGLIAGLSLWDCIVLNLLSRQPGGHLNLLEHYHPLPLPSHALHFLLLSVVLLSLIDRFDLARIDRKCLESFVRSPTQIILLAVLLCVLLALVVTLSLAAIDQRVALFFQQPELWSDVLTAVNITHEAPPTLQQVPASPTLLQVPSPTHPDILYVPSSTGDPVSSTLTPFLALTIVRAACCCLSWGASLWLSTCDRLQEYLKNICGRDLISVLT